MENTLISFDEFRLAFSHVEKLLDRRQSTTSFYLSVNTGISVVIGLLLRDAPFSEGWLAGSILLLLGAGVIACWIWRSLLRQYEVLLDWWYARLRELEASIPDSARLVTREYEELYGQAKEHKPSQRMGMTQRELMLNWILSALYAAFAVAIALDLLF